MTHPDSLSSLTATGCSPSAINVFFPGRLCYIPHLSAWGRASAHFIYNSGKYAQFPHRKNTSRGPSGALLQPYLYWPAIWSTFRCSHSIRQHLMSLTSPPGLCSLAGQQGPLLPAPGSTIAFLRIMPSHDHEIIP